MKFHAYTCIHTDKETTNIWIVNRWRQKLRPTWECSNGNAKSTGKFQSDFWIVRWCGRLTTSYRVAGPCLSFEHPTQYIRMYVRGIRMSTREAASIQCQFSSIFIRSHGFLLSPRFYLFYFRRVIFLHRKSIYSFV